MSKNVTNTELKDNPNNTSNNVIIMPSGVSHGFDTGYAKAYGVDEAIMIRNFQWFITANGNAGINFHQERFWTYNTVKEFPKHFPYWNADKCRRLLESLVRQKVLIKSDFNPEWSNRTSWYAFVDQDKFAPDIIAPKVKKPIPGSKIQETSTDLAKLPNDNCQICQMTIGNFANSILDTSTISSAISSPSSSLKVSSMPSKKVKTPEKEKQPAAPDAPRGAKRSMDTFSSEVIETTQKIIEMLTNHEELYKPPGNLIPMLTAVEAMLEKDKYKPEMVLNLLNDVLGTSFWAGKVFTSNPSLYLRKNFCRLRSEVKPRKIDSNSIDRRMKDKDGKTCDNWKDDLF